MIKSARLFAGVELALLSILWLFTVWGAWRWTGATIWTGLGFVSLAGVVVTSVVMRRPGWRSAGFRLDNLCASLVVVAVAAGSLLLICFAVGPPISTALESISANRAIQIIALGVVQQALFSGYLLQRWRALLPHPVIAVIANALLFAFLHLPNASLVVVTVIAGVFFGALFIRAPNVYAVGLAHGLLSLLGGPLLQSSGVLETKRIGPAELAPFVATIAVEWRHGDRIGVGPHSIAPHQFGRGLPVAVEFIGGPDVDESVNRQRIVLFLQLPGRVYCVLTEGDFRRYVDAELQTQVPVLAERFILRRKFSFSNDLFDRFFHGGGDAPILAVFREKVLLVTNNPRITQ